LKARIYFTSRSQCGAQKRNVDSRVALDWKRRQQQQVKLCVALLSENVLVPARSALLSACEIYCDALRGTLTASSTVIVGNQKHGAEAVESRRMHSQPAERKTPTRRFSRSVDKGVCPDLLRALTFAPARQRTSAILALCCRQHRISQCREVSPCA
jgi:hypothetical protein